MPNINTWGGSWGSSWGSSWNQDQAPFILPEFGARATCSDAVVTLLRALDAAVIIATATDYALPIVVTANFTGVTATASDAVVTVAAGSDALGDLT